MATRINTRLFLLFLLTISTQGQGQLFDFFSGLQPVIQPYTTSKPALQTTKHTNRQTNNHSSRRTTKTTENPYFNLNFFTTTVKPRKTTRKTNNDNSGITFPRDITQNNNRNKNNNQKLESTTNSFGNNNRQIITNNNNYYSQDNNRAQNSNRNNNQKLESTTNNYISNNNRQIITNNNLNVNTNNNNDYTQNNNRAQNSNRNNNQKLESTTNNNRQIITNNNNDYNNRNTNNNLNNRQSNSRNPNVSGLSPNIITSKPFSYTTANPLLNRPGVRPAPVDQNRPAITNRPVAKPVVFNKPVQGDSVTFTDVDTRPTLEQGPDEGLMTEGEKRRHLEIAERMCDKYKSMTTTKVEAIALLPSPRPVRVNVSQCTPITIPLVVGGKPVTIREFPHMGLVGWRKVQEAGYSWKCGSSLLSDRFVLTAGHCSYQEKDDSVAIGSPQAVQLGSTYLDDVGALVVKIASVIRHPKYKQQRSYHDIAVVKLTNSVTFSPVIRPACLGAVPEVGRPVIATGWGRTEHGSEQSLELRSVSLPVWDMRECSRVLGVSRKLPDGPRGDNQMCAGDSRGGKDTCQGDSGGPAQIQDGCIWRVVAVTSLGRACGAPNTPGLYALAQRAFISSIIFSGITKNNQNKQTTFNNNDNNSGQNNNNDRPIYENNNNDKPIYNNNNAQDYRPTQISNSWSNDRNTGSNSNTNSAINNNYNQNFNNQFNSGSITYDNNNRKNNNQNTAYDSYQNNDNKNTNNNVNDRIVFDTEIERPNRRPANVALEKPWWLG